MNIIQVKVHIPTGDDSTGTTIPVAVPDIALVRALADRLHREGAAYTGQAWGWPVQYDPEIREDAAVVTVPDEQGGERIELRPFWSPASFTIGESGIWFYSLLWEGGRDQAPTEWLDTINVLAPDQ